MRRSDRPTVIEIRASLPLLIVGLVVVRRRLRGE
jgi:hypothetical protein